MKEYEEMDYPAFIFYPVSVDDISAIQLRRMKMFVNIDAIIREHPEEYKRIQEQEGSHGCHRAMDQ
jgi:hypothetical protein